MTQSVALNRNNYMLNQSNRDIVIASLRIRKPNRILLILLVLLIIVILGILDLYTGYEIGFSFFYLIPITLTVMFLGFKAGLLVSILSTMTWYWVDLKSGSSYSNSFIPVWNASMRFGYFILHSYLLSRFLDLYEKVKIDSYTDPLTGIYNSRLLLILLEREVLKAKRSQLASTLIYFDLDNFKLINDQYGHAFGDSLLKIISNLVFESIRPYDIFARIGGDEFAILLPETDYDSADILIGRIIRRANTELTNMNLDTTLSIGAITFTDSNPGSEELMKIADSLMYEVKKSGKNNIKHIIFEN